MTMPSYRKFSANDWPLYIDEVHVLYIGERKPVKELIEHFRRTYQVEITENQFKKFFQRQKAGPNAAAWSKNLTAGEWQAIDRIVEEREKEGKLSKLTHNGRQYDTETLRRDRRRARRRPGVVPAALNALVTTPPAATSWHAYRDVITSIDYQSPSRIESPFRFQTSDKDQQSHDVGLGNEIAGSMGTPSFSSLISWPEDSPDQLVKDCMINRGLHEPETTHRPSSPLWSVAVRPGTPVYSALRIDYLYHPDLYPLVAYLDSMQREAALTVQEPRLCLEVSHSWSLEGLRHIASAIVSSKILSPRLGHLVTDVQRAVTADLLDLAICSLKCYSLFSEWQDYVDNAGMLLFEWLVNRQHMPLFAILGRTKSTMVLGFFDHWANLAERVISLAAVRQRHTSSILAVVKSAPDSVITESNCRTLLHIAYWEMDIIGTELCRQLIRRIPNISWIGEYYCLEKIIEFGAPDILETFLEARTSRWSEQLELVRGTARENLTQDAISKFKRALGYHLLQYGRVVDHRTAAVVAKFYPDSLFADPCWAGLCLMDIMELLCPAPLKVDSSKAMATSPVTRTIRAAREGSSQKIALLRSQSCVSEYDLQLALFGATLTGCADVIRTLLRSGVDPDASLVVAAHYQHYLTRLHRYGSEGTLCLQTESPLHFQWGMSTRSELENINITCDLLKHGARVTHSNIFAVRPIFEECSPEEIMDILACRPDIVRDHGPALLYFAISMPTYSTFPQWLRSILPPDIVNMPVAINDECTWTNLQYSLVYYSFDIFKLLWECGGRFQSAPDAPGGIELTLVKDHDSDSAAVEKAGFLLKQGATADCEVPNQNLIQYASQQRTQRTTPLIMMLEWARYTECHLDGDVLRILKMLLDAGADPNRVVEDSLSTLELACMIGSLPLVNMLLRGGANIQPDSNLLRSLIQSRGDILREESDDTIDLGLLNFIIQACRDAEMDMRVQLSRALMAAAVFGLVDIAKILLQAGADPHFFEPARLGYRWKDEVCTAIEAAAVGGYLEMVRLLLEAEGSHPAADLGLAQVREADNSPEQMTTYDRLSRALRRAKKQKHFDVVGVLESHIEVVIPYAPQGFTIDLNFGADPFTSEL